MSVSRLPSGRYRAQVYNPATGKTLSAGKVLGLLDPTFPSRSAARAGVVDARRKLQMLSGRTEVTVAGFRERWLSDPLFERPKRATMIAYADPPYPGQAKRLYGDHPDYAGEVDHAELIARLERDFSDGWALSTSEQALRDVLALAPTGTRVLAWCKTDAPYMQITPQYGWEPVLMRGGRHVASGLVRNWLTCAVGRWMDDDVIGAKPPTFCNWIFDCLGAEPDDELVDLFPGSRAISTAWANYKRQPSLLTSSWAKRWRGTNEPLEAA